MEIGVGWGNDRESVSGSLAGRGTKRKLTILRMNRLDLLQQASKARSGRWALARVEFSECDAKHRSVVPMRGDCGSTGHLANDFFLESSKQETAVDQLKLGYCRLPNLVWDGRLLL